jgi:hypothetical protein
MPVRAKELGIALLGENSGGGGCALLIDFMASGYYMNMSGMPKFRGENEDTDVDLGAAPDYELAYNEMFDSKTLSAKIHEFYGDYKNEWVDGKWYDKNGKQTYDGIAQWKKSSKGWWYGDGYGWYAKNQWQKIDGIWYYFKPDGYMAANEYYKGYWFNSDGSWDEQYFLTWKSNSKGWWVEDISGWWPSSSWLKIDGDWYYFNSSGYMVTSQYVDGWWIGADGVCR